MYYDLLEGAMDLQTVKFRTANENDIKDIMNIEISSFREDICEREEVFLERISIFPEGFFIMEYDRKVIGYLCSEIWAYKERLDEEDFILGHSIGKYHDPNGSELYISSMGILPSFRGRGMGKLMFEEFLRYMIRTNKGLETVILIVSEGWEKARRIYSDNGFEEISVLKNFFEVSRNQPYSENGIVMRKYL